MSVTMDGATPSPPSGKDDDDEDGDRTPPAKRPSSKGQDISANLIDPALHSSGSSPEADATTLRTAQAATEVAERADSQWVSLVRALEGLRGWINYRIDHEDFDSEDTQAKEDASMAGSPTAEERVQQLQQHEQQPEPQESIRDDVSMGGLESDAEPEPERREKESTVEPAKPSSGTDEGENAVMYPTLRGLDDDGDSKMPS